MNSKRAIDKLRNQIKLKVFFKIKNTQKIYLHSIRHVHLRLCATKLMFCDANFHSSVSKIRNEPLRKNNIISKKIIKLRRVERIKHRVFVRLFAHRRRDLCESYHCYHHRHHRRRLRDVRRRRWVCCRSISAILSSNWSANSVSISQISVDTMPIAIFQNLRDVNWI